LALFVLFEGLKLFVKVLRLIFNSFEIKPGLELNCEIVAKGILQLEKAVAKLEHYQGVSEGVYVEASPSGVAGKLHCKVSKNIKL
jgi:hypothetical protein